jgi:ElaB/YqjD/DUF883 family membrane-anchored ribosome-binding protein
MATQTPETKSANEDYEQVKADLKALRDDLGKLSKSVADGQKSTINSFRDEVRREGQEALDYARGAGEKAVGEAEDRIAQRPFLTVIVLFLAGLVVGKLLDR